MILYIHNKKIDFFNSFSMQLRHDAIASTFAFSWYYNPLNEEHKEAAHVGHYHKVRLEENGEQILYGQILSQSFKKSSVTNLATISGYSITGFLEDCHLPISSYPLQSNGLTLAQIARKLLAPFKLNMIIDPLVSARMNQVLKETTIQPTQTIKDYLTQLALQKNILVTHDGLGNVVFTEVKTTQAPILNIVRQSDGKYNFMPILDMAMSFNGQGMHSDITVLRQADTNGGNAGEYTIKNPYVPFVFRSRTVTQSSGDNNDTQLAARSALSEELKNIQLTITLDRWDINGKIIRPNNIISVLNPDCYINKKTNFFIESVDLSGDNTQKKAVLSCVLPEVYTNQIPKNIFEPSSPSPQ